MAAKQQVLGIRDPDALERRSARSPGSARRWASSGSGCRSSWTRPSCRSLLPRWRPLQSQARNRGSPRLHPQPPRARHAAPSTSTRSAAAWRRPWHRHVGALVERALARRRVRQAPRPPAGGGDDRPHDPARRCERQAGNGRASTTTSTSTASSCSFHRRAPMSRSTYRRSSRTRSGWRAKSPMASPATRSGANSGILEKLNPNLARGLEKSGRERSDFDLNAWLYVAPGANKKECIEDARATVIFYSLLEQYERYFAECGFGAEAARHRPPPPRRRTKRRCAGRAATRWSRSS